MRIEEFIAFISCDHPLHIICNPEMSQIQISDALSSLLSYSHTDKAELIQQIKAHKADGSSLIKLNRKLYTICQIPFTFDGAKQFLFKLEAFNINDNKDVRIHCLEEILSSINDGIIVSDRESRIVMYNPAQEKLEDLSSSEIVGKYLWEAYNYESIETSEHREVLNTGQPIIDNYSAHSHKDGIAKYVSYSTFPIRKNGEIVAIYSISKNETSLMNLLSETIELKRCIRGSKKNKRILTNGTRFTFSDIVGTSERTCATVSEAESISLVDSNLLIVGETGTGKEVYAQSIHNLGKNKNQPFVAINCGAIPENLLESTLFGTVKGSYTGAQTQTGLFEQAKSGTLFLDELNSLPFSMQSKLLRVLQERKVRPIGSNETKPIQCRIISAINEDPYKIIESGKLRQDLFYRISSVHLQIPPLRNRMADLPSLIGHFINKYNNLFGKNIDSVSDALYDVLFNYNWPGNIRELEHIIENMMIRATAKDRMLLIEHIPAYTKSLLMSSQSASSSDFSTCNLTTTLKSIEERMIREQLNKNNWNISKTARDLGIVRQSLIYRIQKLNIRNPYTKK